MSPQDTPRTPYSIVPVQTDLDVTQLGFTELNDGPVSESALDRLSAKLLADIRADVPDGTRFVVVPSPEMGSWDAAIERLRQSGNVEVVDDAIDVAI